MNISFRSAVLLCVMLITLGRPAHAEYMFTTIDYPGAASTLTFGIGNAGQIVGEYHDVSGVIHAFVLSDGEFAPFDYPGSSGTTALGINSLGDIVGIYGDASANTHAFQRIGDNFTEHLPVAGSNFTSAASINDAGHIVGSYCTNNVDRGYLFDGTTYTTLNRPGALKTIALGINNAESIVGAYISTGQPHGFLLGGGNYNLGNALLDRGQLKDAIAAFRRAIELQPDLAPAHNGLGTTLRDQGQLDEAVAAYRKAIQLKPADPAAYNNLAWLLTTATAPKHRDPTHAVELAARAVELAPKDGGLWNTLGIARYCAGRWQPAVDALGKSFEPRDGGDANDWFFLAMAHWQMGHKDEARTWYDKAIEWMDKNQPMNVELLRFRAEAAKLLGISEPAKSTDAAKPP